MNTTDAREARIAKRYLAGATIRELAKLEGVSQDTMSRRLTAMGVAIRGPGGKKG